LKWAVAVDGRWQSKGEADYDELPAFALQVPSGSACYIASVTSADREALLTALLRSASIEPKWLSSQASFGDLSNSYVAPQQLGVDRWMALIAARRRTTGTALVVSVGTAMTVDALAADGTFLGGLIAPGPTLMQNALQQGTARVAAEPGSWQAFPRTTADAMQSGIIAALSGAVLQQYARLKAATQLPPRCLLTGGAAEMLSPHLDVDAEWVPALVLEGIDWVARESEAA
jgi:type III pantothenate kinase